MCNFNNLFGFLLLPFTVG